MSHRRYSDGRRPLPGDGHLEDYTLPFLIVAGILCFVALFFVWALGGLPLAMICAVLADWLIPRR